MREAEDKMASPEGRGAPLVWSDDLKRALLVLMWNCASRDPTTIDSIELWLDLSSRAPASAPVDSKRVSEAYYFVGTCNVFCYSELQGCTELHRYFWHQFARPSTGPASSLGHE
jgi:hypothetical protein